MAERVSWAVSHSPGVVTTTDARHTLGSRMWPASTATGKRAGRLPKASLDAFNVTATPTTPDGFVHVAPGHLWTMGTRSIAPYVQTLDAIKDLNILATPAHATLTRWDLVIAQQNDELHADADNTWTIKVVAGTAAASPADPVVTGSPDYVVLARVVVGPTVTAIVGGNITQLLVAHTVPVGALLPVLNQAERDALTGTRYDGMAVWREDRDWIEVFDPTLGGWRVQGTAVCSSVADRNATVTSPYNGLQAFTTDTNTTWVFAGGAWVALMTQGIGGIQVVLKSADETVNNSTVLQDDDHLTMPVAIGTYLVELNMVANSAVAPGFRTKFSAPAATTGQVNGLGANGFNVPVLNTLDWGGIAADQQLALSGRIVFTNSGIFKLQWCQSTANATNTTLRHGAMLRLTRVA